MLSAKTTAPVAGTYALDGIRTGDPVNINRSSLISFDYLLDTLHCTRPNVFGQRHLGKRRISHAYDITMPMS